MGAEALFVAVTRMTLAASGALLAMLALRRVLRRHAGAQVAYAAWSVVPLLMLATLLPMPVRALPGVSAIGDAVAASAVMASAASIPIDWHASVLTAWLGGVLALAAWLVLQQRAYRRRLGRLQRADRRLWIAPADCDAALPAVVGVWRPRIVLPAEFSARYDARERALILAHEQVHVRRGDTRINALAATLRCLCWFNPLIHYAAARFRMDQELACDAAVIARFPRARRRYAEAMLKAQSVCSPSDLAVHCSWPTVHPLKERIAMLKHPLPSRTRRIAGAVLLAAFGISGALVTWAAQSTRPLAIAAPAGTQVDARLQIRFGDAPATSVRIINPLGESFAVRADADPSDWQVDMIARAVEGDAIELAMTVRRDAHTLAQPLIVVRQGAPASVESGAQGQPDFWRIDATLALLNADEVARIQREINGTRD